MIIRTLIVDDEPLGRSGISTRLRGEPDVEVVAECANGRQAVDAIRALAPDLLYLDVQMPGLNGFEVLKACEAETLPAVIFVTAFDRYALRAFEVHALDYLLKPIDDERFRAALGRVRSDLSLKRESSLGRRVAALLAENGTVAAPSPAGAWQVSQPPPARFVLKSGGRILFVKAEEVDWVEAAGDYVCFHLGAHTHLLRDTITAVEARLGPDFLRIHRSLIVNGERVRELLPYFNCEYHVILSDGTRLKSSRGYRERLREHFGDQL